MIPKRTLRCAGAAAVVALAVACSKDSTGVAITGVFLPGGAQGSIEVAGGACGTIGGAEAATGTFTATKQ